MKTMCIKLKPPPSSGADTEHWGKCFPVILLSAAQTRDMTHGTHDITGASDKPCHADPHDAHTGVPTPDAHDNMALQGEYQRTTQLSMATPEYVYTDRSLKRGEESKARAGVYFTSTRKTMHIKFTGKTAILRAELIAILAASKEWFESQKRVIHRQLTVADQHTISGAKKGRH